MRVLDYAFGFKQWFPGHRFDTWRVFFCMRFVYATVLSLISFVLEDSNFYLTWSIFLTKVSFWSKQLRQIISVKSNFRSISDPRRSSKLKEALVFSNDAPASSFCERQLSQQTHSTEHKLCSSKLDIYIYTTYVYIYIYIQAIMNFRWGCFFVLHETQWNRQV